MRSIIYSETGDPSVLRLVDRDVSEPGPGEVRVRVVVSGVNPTDWKFRVGSGDGAAPPFPEVTPNQDGAGVIDAVGEGVTNVAVGDRVSRRPRAADGHRAGVHEPARGPGRTTSRR